MRTYFSLANLTAGFLGTMVGFTSSVALVYQAAKTAGANEAEVGSWILALGLSIAITCIMLSFRYRIPILTGWSTPGAALLITSLSGASMAEAIGAFIVAALLTLFAGLTGLFERVMSYIPQSLCSAMLAGILLNFGMNIFSSMEHQFMLVFPMFLIYLLLKPVFPRYVILIVLILGIALTHMQGLLHLEGLHFSLSSPIFTTPVFTLSSFISIGLPLFVVTMTSQNLPGTVVLKSNGYNPPVSPLISFIGLTTLVFAPFGCYAINLAAITAAICAGSEADNNPNRRYKATIFAGICWVIVGLFGASIVALFSALPQELILSIAGLALLSTIGNSLKTSLEQPNDREPALITILVSASGISLFGIGAAFWGLVAGVVSLGLLNWRQNKLLSTKAA